MIQVYIKQCSLCGLLYFGQTIQKLVESEIKYPNDQYYYEGSGRLWREHNKIFGHEIHKTKILFKSNVRTEIEKFCQDFTKANLRYWESDEFANLIEEDGKESCIGELSSHPRWKGGKSFYKLSKDILNTKREIDLLINEAEKRFVNHLDDWTINCRLNESGMPIEILKSAIKIWPKDSSTPAGARTKQDYKLLKRPWGLLNFKLLEYNLLYNVKLETPVIYDLNIWKSLQYSMKQIPSHTLDEPDSWRVDNFGSYHIAADRTWDLEMDEMDLQDLEL